MFFTSQNIQGLRIVYDLETKQFRAGTPQLSSPPVNIYDDIPHQIIYTYKKGFQQALFIDGVQVNSSDYRPNRVSPIVGFVISDFSRIDQVDIQGIEVSMYDKETSSDRIQNLK